MLKYLYIILVSCVLSSCLSNLNVTEFFRKLEIKSPQYYEIISSNRSEIEESIKQYLEKENNVEIEKVLYWGEGRYACGKVVVSIEDVDYVVTSGYYFTKDNPDKKKFYQIYFIPNFNGQISDVIYK